MQIYEALKKDHEKVKKLLTNLISLEDAEETKRTQLIAKIRDALIPHSRAEESVFYNSLRLIDTTKKLAMHGYKDHLEAEALLRTLQLEDKVNVNWRTTALKLKAALEHHIQEEETMFFAAARQLFTEDEATMMTEAFEALKPRIKEENIMGTTLEMVANLMPPRFSANFKSSNQNTRV